MASSRYPRQTSTASACGGSCRARSGAELIICISLARLSHRVEIGGEQHIAKKLRHGHVSGEVWAKIVAALKRPMSSAHVQQVTRERYETIAICWGTRKT
jgi:hypothetical protein